ncbi:MAG: hypothetical protein F6K65_23795 [Moorea sp. SIO3C2]|nr:hypothetical protein [Moorena sp. SIO3C2]
MVNLSDSLPAQQTGTKQASIEPRVGSAINAIGLLAFWPRYANGHATRTATLKAIGLSATLRER